MAASSPLPAPARTAARRTLAPAGLLGWIERRTGITTAGLILFGLGVVGWILARLIGGKGLFLLVYCGWMMIAVAFLIARRKRDIQATRSELSRRTREGQVLEVEIQLNSKRRLGMFTVEEKMHPHLGAPVRVSVESVSPRDGWSYRYTLRPHLRGVYNIGPLTAVWGDPLGLAHSEQVLVEPTELLVHPSTEGVFDRPLTRMLEDPPIRPPKTKPWPTGFEFYGMRDYVPGDDLRRIVWNAVARTGRMLVRESEQGVTDSVNVLIDTEADAHRPGDPSDTFETAIRVAASVGTGHIKNGFSVSLDSGEGNLSENLRGPRARLFYLDELARLNRGKAPLHHGVERLLRRRAANSHNVIITSQFDSKAAARASLIVAAGASVLVAVIMWEETDLSSLNRATEIGAQVVQIRPGDSLAGVFRHALGAGIR